MKKKLLWILVVLFVLAIAFASFCYYKGPNDVPFLDRIEQGLSNIVNGRGTCIMDDGQPCRVDDRDVNELQNKDLDDCDGQPCQIADRDENELQKKDLDDEDYGGRYGDGFTDVSQLYENLDAYLQPDNPKVIRHAKTGDYEIFTLDFMSKQPFGFSVNGSEWYSCNNYGGSDCVNVITKNGRIIYRNIPRRYNGMVDEVGSFSRLTNSGAIFQYSMGEGGPCGGGGVYYLTYYNFEIEKLFYAEDGRHFFGKYAECCGGEGDDRDEDCEDFEWITTYYLNFFNIPDFDLPEGQEYREPLDIQADNIEEAFYKYYHSAF